MKTRFAAIVVGASLATLHVACYDKPAEPLSPDASGSGTGTDAGNGTDATTADASRCVTTSDDFNTPDLGSMPCGAWGTVESGTVTRLVEGVLEVNPNSIGSGNHGCVTSAAFSFANGASIEVPQIMSGGMLTTTYFGVYTDSTRALGARITLNHTPGSDYAELYCNTSMNVGGFPAITMNHRWWKMVPSPTTGSIDVYSGSNGVAYTLFGTCASNVGMTVYADMGGFANPDLASTPAQFDNFNTTTCPPP